MKAPARNNLIVVGLTTMLAVTAVGSSLTPRREHAADSGSRHLVQYCVPRDDDILDAARVYCNKRGSLELIHQAGAGIYSALVQRALAQSQIENAILA
jgi:hypothetical protein